MGCRDTVLPAPLLKNHSVNFLKCLTTEKSTRKPYNDNLCLSTALALHLHGNERREEETSKLFNLFLKKISGNHPENFPGVCKEDIAAVEDIVWADIFLYDIEIVDRSMIGELPRRTTGKHSKTVRLLRYISQICYVSNINALFKAYRCPSRDQFIEKAYNLEQYLITCKERTKHVFPKNLYQPREKLFGKLGSFNILYFLDQKFFENMSIFDFESICVQEEIFAKSKHLNHKTFYAIPIPELWWSHLLMLSTG